MPLKTFFSMLWDKSSYLVYTHIESEVIDQEGFDCEHKSTEQSRAQTVRTHKILTWAMPIFFTSCVAALSVASFYIGRRSVINEAQTYRTKSDFVFGDVPVKKVRWINDHRFMETDPMAGRFWSNKEGKWTVWDQVHRGSWIQIAPSEKHEIFGGLPLNLYSANGSWPNGKEGYVTTVLHQLHCVGMLNHFKLELLHGNMLDANKLEHMGHCIEYLRQVSSLIVF
ncbi:hypothetical protein N7516_003604 [Penicillium verrucosum]|uniref:uncharacterized protein n=1 Tax=Penicillium verrucosum TaxID=60171 RepID=UPI0025452596|nr:uncharacterized protein N7516_003604 [Penicillium verrucosum]KAJ5943436.1 hypothetical protein N7516_003604 [Penicillium verrucosum]